MRIHNFAQPTFVIYAPSFDIKKGGIIALHYLCHLLNKQGAKAYLFPAKLKKPYLSNNIIKTSYNYFKFIFWYLFSRKYDTYKNFNTPIIKNKKLVKKAVVIYSETVDGNPLKANKIVRWLLHIPGYHTGKVNYESNELYFYWQKKFIDKKLQIDQENQLCIPYYLTDIYKQYNYGERNGACYIIKKGKKRKIELDLSNALIIDKLQHEEIARIFNKKEYCISYDTYTMFSRYAAICGCKSVVIPEEGITKEQWQPTEELRYGIAYGFEDIDHALNTIEDLKKYINHITGTSDEQIQSFIRKTIDFFKI